MWSVGEGRFPLTLVITCCNVPIHLLQVDLILLFDEVDVLLVDQFDYRAVWLCVQEVIAFLYHYISSILVIVSPDAVVGLRGFRASGG